MSKKRTINFFSNKKKCSRLQTKKNVHNICIQRESNSNIWNDQLMLNLLEDKITKNGPAVCIFWASPPPLSFSL